jgi:acyl-CoA synthetase (AMP-forming)/AMP-acid ligase II
MLRLVGYHSSFGRKIPVSDASRLEKANRVSTYYIFESSAKLDPNGECLWSREGCYSWAETLGRVHQYAQWYLSQGVKPNDLVSFYLTNSPDFIFAWLGLWAVGAAPTMINYNLSGKALIHCLKVAGSKLILVDEEEVLLNRIEDDRAEIEKLGMQIHVLNGDLRQKIYGMKPERPADSCREQVKGNWPVAIFYTRYLGPSRPHINRGIDKL